MSGPCLGPRLLGVADDLRDFRHVREGRGLDLRRATRHDDADARPLARQAADVLLGLPDGFGRHRAGVEDHDILADAHGGAADRLGFDGV